MLELNYALTEEEYIDYNYFTGWDAPHLEDMRKKYYLRQIVFCIISTVVTFYLTNYSIPITAIFTGIGIVLLLRSAYIQKNTLKERAKRFIAKEENQAVLSSTTIQLSETGIFSKDEFAETRYQWKSIIRRTENERSYFLYISSVQALIIPKRVFKNDEQKAAFEKILNQNVSLQAEFEES